MKKNKEKKQRIAFHDSAAIYRRYLKGEKGYEWLRQEYQNRYKVRLKNSEQVAGIRKCGQLVLELLDGVEQLIRPGMVLAEIDSFIHEKTLEAGAVPAPLNYRGFPKSVCVSINEVVCHGIPDKQVLKDGDIVNVDVTPILNGYYADANKTFFVGTAGAAAKKIVSVAAKSLALALDVVRPGATLGDIGYAIQRYAEGQGCSVVREFVGHGVGLDFHEQPFVPHFGLPGRGLTLVPGMVFTIEPMVNIGKREIRILEDKWTAVTADGSLSAQFEQTIVITENSWESLTPFTL